MLFFLFVTICYFFFFRNNIRNEDYFESGNEHVLFTFFFSLFERGANIGTIFIVLTRVNGRRHVRRTSCVGGIDSN